MAAHAPALVLDPLIAEARLRARRRRFLALAVLVVAGAVAATVAWHGSENSRPIVVVPPACRSSQLRVAVQYGGVAAGTTYEAFRFTNVSANACSLSGWPTIRLVLRDGRVVNPETRDLIATAYSTHHPPPVPHIPLGPGSSAVAHAFQADGTGLDHACQATRAVLLTAPGGRSPIAVRASISYCGPRYFSVLPIGRKL